MVFIEKVQPEKQTFNVERGRETQDCRRWDAETRQQVLQTDESRSEIQTFSKRKIIKHHIFILISWNLNLNTHYYNTINKYILEIYDCKQWILNLNSMKVGFFKRNYRNEYIFTWYSTFLERVYIYKVCFLLHFALTNEGLQYPLQPRGVAL